MPASLEEPPPRTGGWTLTEDAIDWNYLYGQALTELELLLRLEHIDTAAENETATIAQMASVILEAVFLIIGILVAAPYPTGTALNRVIQAISQAAANSSSLRQAVEAVQAAYQVGTRKRLQVLSANAAESVS